MMKFLRTSGISLNKKSCFAKAKQALKYKLKESPKRSGGLSTLIFHFSFLIS